MRRVFKILYGSDHAVMFQWFVRGYWPKATVTNVVSEGSKKSKKGSIERRVLQAVLHGNFTLDELKRIVNEHEELMDGFYGCAERKESETDR